MTVTISSEDPRSIKALEIAASASQWFRCQTAKGKRYGIRSSRDPNHYYLTDQHNCTCQDAERHPELACKHQLAVRLYVELVKAGAVPRPASDVLDGLEQMVSDRQGPVLDMLRHPDGEITWERTHRHPAPTAETIRRAATYDRIFGRFYDETPEQIMGRL